MQTNNIYTELAHLLSRLIPRWVSIRESDSGELVLYVMLGVVGEIDGVRWSRLAAKCPWWRERISAVRVEFMDAAAHSVRVLRVGGSLEADDGLMLEDGSKIKITRVWLPFALTEMAGVIAEELPPVETITFCLARADGTVVCEVATRRVAVANVPSAEREGC